MKLPHFFWDFSQNRQANFAQLKPKENEKEKAITRLLKKKRDKKGIYVLFICIIFVSWVLASRLLRHKRLGNLLPNIKFCLGRQKTSKKEGTAPYLLWTSFIYWSQGNFLWWFLFCKDMLTWNDSEKQQLPKKTKVEGNLVQMK